VAMWVVQPVGRPRLSVFDPAAASGPLMTGVPDWTRLPDVAGHEARSPEPAAAAAFVVRSRLSERLAGHPVAALHLRHDYAHVRLHERSGLNADTVGWLLELAGDALLADAAPFASQDLFVPGFGVGYARAGWLSGRFGLFLDGLPGDIAPAGPALAGVLRGWRAEADRLDAAQRAGALDRAGLTAALVELRDRCEAGLEPFAGTESRAVELLRIALRQPGVFD
jgi:hypothetical protein